MSEFRKRLFSRIVPNVKKIGLWGPKIQAAFLDMGVLDFQDVDVDALMAEDEDIAQELDRILAARRANGTIAAEDAATRAGEIATTIAAARMTDDGDVRAGGRAGARRSTCDVVVIGSGFGGQRHRPAAHREGVPGRRARGRAALRRVELPEDLVAAALVLLGARARLLRPAADLGAQGRHGALRRRRGRRLAAIRQHPLRTAPAVLRRPAVGGDHRLARRAGPRLRPGQAHAGRGATTRP